MPAITLSRLTGNMVRGMVSEISRIAYARHLTLGHEDGHYTLGEVCRYWRCWEDNSWEIECLPRTPRVMTDLLECADSIFLDLNSLIATHKHDAKDKWGQCPSCGEFLDT